MTLLFTYASFVVAHLIFAEAAETCHQVIVRLAKDEKFTRSAVRKVKLATDTTSQQTSANPDEKPLADLSKLLSKANGVDGTVTNSRATQGWVTEVLTGTKLTATNEHDDKTPEGKPASDAQASAFKSTTSGAEIKKLFEKHAAENGQEHVVYSFQLHTGLGMNHAWVIHQSPTPPDPLPKGVPLPRYRVYQSYDGAYTLDAWLTPASQSYTERDSHIYQSWFTRCALLPQDTDLFPRECDKLGLADLQTKGHGLIAKLKEQAAKEDKTAESKPYTKMLELLEGANKGQPKQDFVQAWADYGRGDFHLKEQIYEWEHSFVGTLTRLLDWLQTDAATPVGKDVYALYKDLFGAPLLTVYPGLPKDTFVALSTKGKLLYHAQVLPQKADAEVNSACVAVAGRLSEGLTASPTAPKRQESTHETTENQGSSSKEQVNIPPPLRRQSTKFYDADEPPPTPKEQKANIPPPLRRQSTEFYDAIDPTETAKEQQANPAPPTTPQQKTPPPVPEILVKCAEKKQGWNKLGNGAYVRCKYAKGSKTALIPERCGCDPLWTKVNEVSIPSVEVCPGYFYEIHERGWICVCPRNNLKTEFGAANAKDKPAAQGKKAKDASPRTCI